MALVRFPANRDYPDVLGAMAEPGAFSPDVESITQRVQEGGIPSAGAKSAD